MVPSRHHRGRGPSKCCKPYQLKGDSREHPRPAVLGGLIGWVTSLIMRTNAQQGVLLNVAVGIVASADGAGAALIRDPPKAIQQDG